MREVPSVARLEVVADERLGQGGFLELRRLRLRNHRSDGTISREYPCDFVERPLGQDAVVVAAWRRGPGDTGPEVLLRQCLRPSIAFGRDIRRAPVAESPLLFLTELVAGIIEGGDHGRDGLCARAAAELQEEAGYVVAPSLFGELGTATFPSCGVIAERHYFLVCEVARTAEPVAADGDGSPMEDGGRTEWLPLVDALAAVDSGAIVDAKTEIALRRLAVYITKLLG